MVPLFLTYLRALAARLIARMLFRGPVVVDAGNTRFVFDPRSGRLWPSMAGGAPDDDDDADSDKDGDDDADAADKDGDDDADADGDDDADADGDDDADADADKDGDDDKRGGDWKRQARKHERRAKAEKRRADELAARLKKAEDKDKSEQEKAIEAAEKKGRESARAESEKERRSDRLQLAITKLSTRGIKVGEGDDAETLKFADPDDAITAIERAIANGDLDADEIFDDKGKVKTDELTSELADLLERKPHYAAGNGNDRRDPGDSDAGKGKRRKDPDDLSVEEHFKKIKRN